MNIKHAHYMLTVLQEGSITAAAKKLYISQPSLSQMIKLVETNLGTPIFNLEHRPHHPDLRRTEVHRSGKTDSHNQQQSPERDR